MRKWGARWATGMLAVVLACAGLAAPAAASIPAAASAPAPVVFILDASGSMVRETTPGVTRMDAAKKATTDTIGALPAGTPVGVLVFGTGTGNDDAQRAAGCSDVKTLAPLAPVDATALARSIGGVAASGFTPIGPALRQAVAMLPASGPANIVLVSDGVDTCAPPSSCEVASQVHRDHPQVTINVVAFGVDGDEAAQQQMTCIGRVGGGTSVTASNPSQLGSHLRAATSADPTRLSALGSHGVRFGMSLDEVRAAVDGAKLGEPRTVGGVVVILVDCGWGTVELRDGRVYAITPQDTSTPTAEGIAPGSARADVEALYGAPVPADAAAADAVVYQVQPGSRVGYRVTYDAANTVKYVIVCRCVAASAVSGDVPDWEVDFDGAGPLALGMDRAAALAAGLQDAKDGSGWVLTNAGGPVLHAAFTADGLVQVRIGGYKPQPGARLPHARGIRLGDSAATAIAAFPGGSYIRSLAGGLSQYVVTNRDGRMLTFDVQRGTAPGPVEDQIRAGTISGITIENAAITRSAAYLNPSR